MSAYVRFYIYFMLLVTGEYISLYHHQRALLQQRETHKNDYIAQLARDREELQVNKQQDYILDRLPQFLSKTREGVYETLCPQHMLAHTVLLFNPK